MDQSAQNLYLTHRDKSKTRQNAHPNKLPREKSNLSSAYLNPSGTPMRPRICHEHYCLMGNWTLQRKENIEKAKLLLTNRGTNCHANVQAKLLRRMMGIQR
jgi:hypothetical protein